MDIDIDPDIRRARTLPSAVYRSEDVYRRQAETVFAPSWQLALEANDASAAGSAAPWTVLPGMLDEPLLFTRDAGNELRCMSNVCTHRGTLLVSQPGTMDSIRCRYHGRRFKLDGGFSFMPEFKECEGFPTADDDLQRVQTASWGPLVFASLAPGLDFSQLIEPFEKWVGFLPLGDGAFDPKAKHDYLVDANWALYCDNYLEGFHIPFVHPGLNEAIHYPDYRTEVFSRGTLQVGVAKEGDIAFELPSNHPAHGERIAALYAWLFPNTMLNFYPWGISINIVMPEGVQRTRVRYAAYVWDNDLRNRGASADLHSVEMEDHAVVTAVQHGIRSRLYDRGRYSPTREAGVHRFHQILAESLRSGE